MLKIIVKILGWKVVNPVPDVKKCVIAVAPHTSAWDFFYGWIVLNSIGLRVNFLIKQEMFFFPQGFLLKKMGAIPIDRKKGNNTINQIVTEINKRESIFLLITPEGTRKYVKRWKKGFYHIALQSSLPVVLGAIDYKEKTATFGPLINPTGDYEEDCSILEPFFRGRTAKYPENYSLS